MVRFLRDPGAMCNPSPSLLLLGLLLPVSVDVPLAQQEASQQVSTGQEHPSRERILILEDGRALRSRARCQAGVWEVHTKQGWSPVTSPVLRQRLESDALLEARALARSLKNASAADPRRVEYLAWLYRQGLVSEACRALARALEEYPDELRLLKLVSQMNLSLVLKDSLATGSPEWQRAAVSHGARGDALERELAARALITLRDRPGFDALLKSLQRDSSSAVRRFGLFLERRRSGGEAWRVFSRVALLDPSERVRHEAALGMKILGDPRVLGPAIFAMNSKYPAVRRNAAAAMGTMGYPAAVEPLITRLAALSGGAGSRSNISVLTQRAVLFDFDVEVAAGASIADPQIVPVTEGVVLDVRVLSSSTITVTEAAAVRGSLAQLTDGVKRNALGWQNWWKANQAEWTMKQHLPKPADKD
ncbi:MAG: hypothetical protein CMJ86_02110 [Planctomycetes bacterium]|nr:hypothetical protein [Planctomycetota bacterium]